MNDTVIRWSDGYTSAPLAEQLRSRPGRRTVIAESLTSSSAGLELRRLRSSLGEGFTVEAHPVDDGIYGVIYEITACYDADD